jgi:hypothetical protein
MARATKRITIEVSAEVFEHLQVLGRSVAMEGARPRLSPELKVARVVGHLVNSAADGVRRPGAWERGWVEQAFGPVPDDDASEVG